MLLENPSYIVSLNLRSGNLLHQKESLSQTIGSNLYKPAVNFMKSLHRLDLKLALVSGLDDKGFSVSPDNYVIVSVALDATAALPCAKFDFAQPLLETIVGQPEVHWDDASDLVLDSRYFRPNRQNNIWASFGKGGGTTAMKQMFALTKGTRRHSFIASTVKFSMLTTPGVPFSRVEVSDFVKRTWSSNPEEQHAPLISRVVDSILKAQDLDNEAEGGRVTDTDCAGRVVKPEPRFYGQVNTSAVLIVNGLGDGRSNISSSALDQSHFLWLQENSPAMDDLLVSRGFIVSVDPALVTLKSPLVQLAASTFVVYSQNA
ncbi:uncharacterized protein BDR25DRAFT_314705 [Lindgomyces ingoldianus]|uniref:Uncharacterized protein n=1 Tax=Lindgomyces ingoldianus TaxID=673940 RepID=A0ACB6QU45_9PLEO|nr:uncharacterized protein BDR25DRAFT_314705 [Lindgomyces ingoldianus]KAF2470529.1 hypothetical protein BDR25DRAFT_314705 [Lindgomyces ingoldianus]